MEFQVNTNNVILSQIDQVESGEYNVTECNFTFSSEFDGLTKKAVFTGEDGTAYLQTIVDGKCSIPSEILATSQVVQIGVYAYAVENEELILRYSPEPTDFFIHEGSYKEAQNSTPPTPSEIEQLQAQITSNKNDIEEIQGDVVDINQDIVDIKAEQITQNENIQTNANNISTINEQISDINETITNLETNKANVTDLNALTERVSTNERDIDTIDGHISDINQNIDDLEQDLTNYSLITETGSQIELNINSSDFKFKAILKDKNGNTIYTSNIIDLPLETMVVGASYDNTTKEVVLTLQNGTTLRFSVADLVSGLVSTEQLTQVLSNYYNKNEVNNLLNAKANQTSLDTTNQNLTTLTGRVSTNEEDIADIKEEQITQNTNIEELQNQVETLQEDLDNAETEIAELNIDLSNMRKASYKVDGQGTDITLENTSDNKFIELGLNGNTEQEQLTGKNLFDKDNAANVLNNIFISGDKFLKSGNKNTTIYIPCKGNTTYTIQKVVDNVFRAGTTQVAPEVNVTVDDYNNNPTGNVITLTTSNNAKYLVVFIQNQETSKSLQIILNSLQIEQGSTATSYEPYCGGIPSPNPDYPQQIKNVTGNANVKICNANLNDEEYENGMINDDGSIGTETNRIHSKNFINIKSNTDYTFSIIGTLSGMYYYMAFYDSNKNIISKTSANSQSTKTFTFTTPANAKYIRIGFSYASLTSIETIQTMLNVGSTATSYVPHQEQNYPFTFAEGQRAMQGTTLQDDGIHQKRNQISLIDDYIGSLITLSNGNKAIIINLPSKKRTTGNNVICNKAINNLTFSDGTFYENNTNIVAIGNQNDTLETLKEKYIGSIFEYTLEQEEIIPYNETQQSQYNNIKANASSYDDITIISSESDELGFDMKAIAVADANKVIESQNNEIDTIKSRLDLLEG